MCCGWLSMYLWYPIHSQNSKTVSLSTAVQTVSLKGYYTKYCTIIIMPWSYTLPNHYNSIHRSIKHNKRALSMVRIPVTLKPINETRQKFPVQYHQRAGRRWSPSKSSCFYTMPFKPEPLPPIAPYSPNAIEVKSLTFACTANTSSVISIWRWKPDLDAAQANAMAVMLVEKPTMKKPMMGDEYGRGMGSRPTPI